ncbi:MAG: hypothetical protein HGA85_07275 [Nanoarchaeota archaeon]|nr:hypothetical protein [Nanoarchaeota archaeon]
MAESLIEQFIKKHYQPVQGLEEHTGNGSLRRYAIAEGRSAVITCASPEGLDAISIDQSPSDYEISLCKEDPEINGYMGFMSERFYPNLFHLKIHGTTALLSPSRILTPMLAIALTMGETRYLAEPEKEYYLEKIGVRLPVEIEILHSESIHGRTEYEPGLGHIKKILSHWMKETESVVEVYDAFRNGPVHYYLKNIREGLQP